MLRTLVWLQSTCGMQLAFKHLFYYGTKASIQALKKSVSNVCSQEVTACLINTGICCKSFTRQVFLKESKEMQITWHTVHIVVRVVHNLPTSATTSRKSSSQYEARCYHAEWWCSKPCLLQCLASCNLSTVPQ